MAHFADVSPDSEGHFRLHFYAVVAGLLAQLRVTSTPEQANQLLEPFPFLAGYQAALQTYQPEGLSPAEVRTWWESQIAAWESRITGHLPLRALVEALGLNPDELRLLMAAGLVEEDIRFGALFAALQEPLAARRPCVGVLGWLLGQPGHLPTDVWPACRCLLDYGLLQTDNQTDPRSEWVLRVPPVVWDALRGRKLEKPTLDLAWQPAQDFPDLDQLILPETLHRQIRQIPKLLGHGQVNALVLRGMLGSGRRTVLGSIARAIGRDVLLWESGTPKDKTWQLLGPLATLAGAMPLLRYNPNPGEALDLPLLPGYNGPVGITLGRSGGLRGPLVEHVLSLNLPPPDRAARRQFWQAAEATAPSSTLDDISDRFLLTGGHIHRAATLGQVYATLDDRASIEPTDVQQATRALNRQALETLATHLDSANGWDDLVIGEATAVELHALETRCQERERLREDAGAAFKNNLNRGVRAMFSGPSGTGKTLAARALAASLQMDLYRVDLAAVVNKYIGETERNLNQVLSRAEELDIVLLLDEGDALMTKRTDVTNANDRYANLETNYLLQRLESYEGIVIVTTNAAQRIDNAFLRRIDVIIHFPPPEAAERWLIWQHHLPQPSSVSPPLLEEIAVRCALTGGQIRNAALHATLLALSDGGQVRDQHLTAALQREYRKAGASYPLRARSVQPGQLARLQQFAAELG